MDNAFLWALVDLVGQSYWLPDAIWASQRYNFVDNQSNFTKSWRCREEIVVIYLLRWLALRVIGNHCIDQLTLLLRRWMVFPWLLKFVPHVACLYGVLTMDVRCVRWFWPHLWWYSWLSKTDSRRFPNISQSSMFVVQLRAMLDEGWIMSRNFTLPTLEGIQHVTVFSSSEYSAPYSGSSLWSTEIHPLWFPSWSMTIYRREEKWLQLRVERACVTLFTWPSRELNK